MNAFFVSLTIYFFWLYLGKYRSAEIDWQRIDRTNIVAIRDNGDVQKVQSFIATVAMGNAEDGTMSTDPNSMKAFKLMQLQLQYLLYSHQALRDKTIEAEKVILMANVQMQIYTRFIVFVFVFFFSFLTFCCCFYRNFVS